MTIQTIVNRIPVSQDYTCEIRNGERSVLVYLGRNSDAAHDMKDNVDRLLAEGVPTAHYVRDSNPGEKPTWKAVLYSSVPGGPCGVLRDFGIGGANKCGDFVLEVNAVLRDQQPKAPPEEQDKPVKLSSLPTHTEAAEHEQLRADNALAPNDDLPL